MAMIIVDAEVSAIISTFPMLSWGNAFRRKLLSAKLPVKVGGVLISQAVLMCAEHISTLT